MKFLVDQDVYATTVRFLQLKRGHARDRVQKKNRSFDRTFGEFIMLFRGR